MAISYGIVAGGSKGDMGRIYDVTLAAADTSGVVDLTQTIDGTAVGMRFLPTIVTITPMSITLTSAQVASAAGGSGSAGTYAGGAGVYTDAVRVTGLTADAVTFTCAGTVLKSFRMWVGRAYQPHAT